MATRTQNDFDQILNDLINEYTGKTIGYYGTYQGECTSPVKYYIERVTEHSSPTMGGRADGWAKGLPDSLKPFFTLEPYKAGKAYPRGTILMWDSPHIAIVNHSDGSNTVSVFEQNADPDGSPCGIKSRTVNTKTHTCLAAMIPILTTSAPPAPAPVSHPYSIQEIDPKQVQIIRDTHKWNLDYDNWTAIETHPVAAAKTEEVKTVQAILIHRLGGHYYLEDPAAAQGFNVVDCKDYTPPAPVTAPPAAPVPIPSSKEPYNVLSTILAFTTSNNAINRTNAVGTVKPGSYFIFNDRKGMGGNILALNVSKVVGKPGSWINVADNVEPEPEPEPLPPVVAAPVQPEPEVITEATPEKPIETEADIRMSIMWLLPNREPVMCQILQNTVATDRVHGGQDIQLVKGKTLNVYATFEQGGYTYALVKLKNDEVFYHMYGVRVYGHDNLGPYLFDLYTVGDKLRYGWEKVYNTAIKTIEGIFSLQKRK